MSVAIMNSCVEHNANNLHLPNNNCEHLEVYTAVAILVKYSEDLIYEDFRISCRQNHGIHLKDLVLAELTVWTVLLESSRK